MTQQRHPSGVAWNIEPGALRGSIFLPGAPELGVRQRTEAKLLAAHDRPTCPPPPQAIQTDMIMTTDCRSTLRSLLMS